MYYDDVLGVLLYLDQSSPVNSTLQFDGLSKIFPFQKIPGFPRADTDITLTLPQEPVFPGCIS